MAEVFESVTVTISKREYAELIGKAFAYDAYARKLKADADRGGYVSEYEQALFVEPKVDIMDIMRDVALNMDSEPEDEEGMEEFFSDEEWQKVIDVAEEEKE